MVIGKGSPDGVLSRDDVYDIASQAFDTGDFDGKRVIVLIPDATRTMPMPLCFRMFAELLKPRTKRLDFLIALGTHMEMSEEAINSMLGVTPEERTGPFEDIRIFNHTWDNPAQLTSVGTITRKEIEEISGGLMSEDVDVTINKLVLDYDIVLVCGPTFPHEVVGFSGGNKYLFPGIAGPDIINFFHWLGAVITNPVINGSKYTPVRAVVDRAAQMVGPERRCFSLVVHFSDLRGMYYGTPEEAYAAAADLSDKVHIVYKDRAYDTVLSQSPVMYDDLWTAAKCFYKLEPVVADGGELIIYAPHVTEVSYTHGKVLDEIGYHTRDYFLAQMAQFKDVPRGVLAHSTHVKGIGTYDSGVEKPRVRCTLATGIPEERCKRINLGYRDPASINVDEYKDKEDEGILYVPKAGEVLHRLKS